MRLVPVPIELPPVGAANQSIVPALGVAASETLPLPQREPGVDAATVGIANTVATTLVRGEEQPVPS